MPNPGTEKARMSYFDLIHAMKVGTGQTKDGKVGHMLVFRDDLNGMDEENPTNEQRAYLQHAYSLWNNPVFRKELERAAQTVLYGVMTLETMDDIKSCRYSYEGFMTLLDNVRILSETYEKLIGEKKEESDANSPSLDEDFIDT